MKKAITLGLFSFLAACAGENKPKIELKQIVQDFSKNPADSIISKYGEPVNSKWNVDGIEVSKMKFDNVNNTTFNNITINPQNLNNETGFSGQVQKGGPGIYSIKISDKSDIVYNLNKKSLRVSLEEKSDTLKPRRNYYDDVW